VEPVVRDPGDEEIEAGQRAELAEREGRVEAGGVDRVQVVDAGPPAGADHRQDLGGVGVAVFSGFYPAHRVDRREARLAVDDGAEPGAEVFRLLVAQMAEDLDGRSLVVGRAGAGDGRIEITRERVQHVG
jgi:hypothetical protein